MIGKSTPPTVAVLLATYNGAAFLAAQLDSLAAQEAVAVEVFVRDDGSTDATLDLLATYARLWPQLAAPLRGDNLGPAKSFLELLRSVPEGFDHYAFCDQDDVWLPDKLARATRRLGEERDEQPALYCSRVMCVDLDLRPLGAPRIDGDGRFQHLLFENIAYGNTVVMNAAAREAVCSRTPTAGVVMHDWWCALVVSAFGAVVYDETPSVLYRQHGGNQIGASANRLSVAITLLKLFWRNPRRFYRIHAQAAEFWRLYGDRLDPRRRRLTETLVASRRTLAGRLRFAFSGGVIRSNRLAALAARVLVAAGWY